ncbi:MAG: hypothetical protein ACM336_03920 [Acidobacteriota bacterium]
MDERQVPFGRRFVKINKAIVFRKWEGAKDRALPYTFDERKRLALAIQPLFEYGRG